MKKKKRTKKKYSERNSPSHVHVNFDNYSPAWYYKNRIYPSKLFIAPCLVNVFYMKNENVQSRYGYPAAVPTHNIPLTYNMMCIYII